MRDDPKKQKWEKGKGERSYIKCGKELVITMGNRGDPLNAP